MRRLYLPAGTKISRYTLIRPIGNGGQAAVYEAFDDALGRRVAIKVRPVWHGGASGHREEARFLREARTAAHISHPHVVSVFDFGIEGGLAFLVMELVEGETLAGLLKRRGALGVAWTLETLLPILSATAELHAQGIVHRDIKPSNVLLKRGDEACPKLTDFGLSQFVEEVSALTDSGMTVGTPEYMAPEVMHDSHRATERSDLYALGVMLYECTTGTRPFCGSTSYEVMNAVMHRNVLPPSALEPSLVRDFDRVVLRAMHRKPSQRFESADELAGALLPFASEEGAARWHGQHPSLNRSSNTYCALPPGGISTIVVNDGVAIAMRGDAVVVLWKAPARMNRIEWMFDVADRFAQQFDGGVVALVIILPSSSPPDYQTTRKCMKRMQKLGSLTRRQAIVAVGGGVWKSIVWGVQRIMYGPVLSRLGRMTISGTIEEGIARILEKASPITPSLAEFRENVLTLHERLDIDAPREIGVQPARVGPRTASRQT
jgi:hypothetical protein